MSSAAPTAGPLPVTIGDWLQAYRDGADARALLVRCHRQVLEHSQPGIWIHIASHAEIDRQLVALEDIAVAQPDRAALLERYPLYGVPFAVKDNIDITGVPTTAACPAFERVATQTAGAVQRLQAAGAVWLGKTNLDQFATGLVGTRSPYGQPACAFSATHISGGSSSGSALAVASGSVAFSLGTDTAGSGRIPAGFNQIVGLKPTPGRVGTSGLVPACRSLDCLSVFALTVDDAAHVLSVVEGVDDEDRYSHFEPGPAVLGTGRGSRGLRIGIPCDPRFTPDSGYERAWALALEHARAIGHVLLPVDFEPLHRIADSLYAGPWVAERHTVVQEMLEAQPQAIDPVVRAVIAGATRFSATDAFRAQYALKESQREMSRLWTGEDGVDALMVPTAPGHPHFIDVAADPLGANAALGTYTNFVNLLGWCALALPAGTVASGAAGGLPFGVTVIAQGNDDAALVNMGRAWQQSTGLPLGATGVRLSEEVAAPWLRSPAVRASLPIAVVGAHLSGMPLNGQLIERGARLLESTSTASHYRLYALPGTTPPKPGLIRVAKDGSAIAVEVWDMPAANVGSFLALIPAPLGIGSIELADGRWVHGFLCEAHALAGAEDISHFGGWRAYMQSLSPAAATAKAAKTISSS